MSRLQRPESSDPRDIAMFVESRFDAIRDELLEHIDAKFEEQRLMFMSAFPASDAARHRLWHQARDEAEDDRRDMTRSIKRWGIVGLFGTLATWNWDAIKEAVKTWIK